jgi:TusA-related sulfurtransferase
MVMVAAVQLAGPSAADRARPDDLAASFVRSLAAQDHDALGLLLAEDLRFRMLLPSGPTSDAGAAAAVARITSWFADADTIDVEASASEEVGGRLASTYRLRVHRTGGWHLIEQHLMLDVVDGRISAIDLLCSGFRPIAEDDDPDRAHRFDAGDLGCADGLAGEFRRRIQWIPVGEVLTVTARDSAAKEDLPSLARLMGHRVLSIEVAGDGSLRMSVERGR